MQKFKRVETSHGIFSSFLPQTQEAKGGMSRNFKDTLITSRKYQERIKRLTNKDTPRWLLGCHVISDIHCREDIGYHYNSKGEMTTLNMVEIEKQFPALPSENDFFDQDYS
jgi:hypothetical protein